MKLGTCKANVLFENKARRIPRASLRAAALFLRTNHDYQASLIKAFTVVKGMYIYLNLSYIMIKKSYAKKKKEP